MHNATFLKFPVYLFEQNIMCAIEAKQRKKIHEGDPALPYPLASFRWYLAQFS